MDKLNKQLTNNSKAKLENALKNSEYNNLKSYGPDEREYLEAPQKIVKSYSEKDYVVLPDNVTDPIATNNISNVEFDYTYGNCLYGDGDEDDYDE